MKIATIAVCIVSIASLLTAESKDTAAQRLRAERAERALATIIARDAAIKSNAKAISALETANRQRAKTALQGAQQGVDVVREAVIDTKATTDALAWQVDAVATKVEAIQPTNYLPIWIAAISAFVAVIGTIGNVVITWITAQHVADARLAIITLEKNTNSIKDALVRVTAESEFAKGLKQGTESLDGRG